MAARAQDNPLALRDYQSYCEAVADAYDRAPLIDKDEVWRWRKLIYHVDKFWDRMQSDVDVRFVSGQPYDSAEQMRREVKRTGVLYISTDFNEHPIYTAEQNLRLRAVHDYIVHILPGPTGPDFSQRGEVRAYNLHRRLAPRDAWPALFTEVAAQACYATVRGKFPVQKIAVLPFDYYNVGAEFAVAANPTKGNPMGFEAGYALGDQFGPEYFVKGANLHEALATADSVYPKHTPILFDGDLYTAEHPGTALVPNRGRRQLSVVSHERSGLGVYSSGEVMALSLKDAHARLRPFFRMTIQSGQHKGKRVVAYDTPRKMQTRFLTANAKLMKGKKGLEGIPPGLSRGPNLLPHVLVAELSKRARLSEHQPNSRITFCVGSNAACRATCLVYSGNNPVADKQVPVKLARSEALLSEPVAWLRMFVGAIDWHIDDCEKQDLAAYVRPNVLSDIPWELCFPDIFELFPGLQFYDYTKVPGRHGRKNYDLTFSFSGTNAKETASELQRGHRVAVVFWLPKPCARNKAPCDKPSDLTFLGQKVIDGDPHDFRPLDPPGSVIGLSYKVPLVKGQRLTKPPKGADKFVIPTFRDPDTGALLVAGTPAQLGAEEVFEHAGPTTLEVA